MKKSLIALAVLGSVAGMAQAQSSVTLYGLADVWVGSTKSETNGVGTSVTKVNGGGLATSRFGLKGSEDLGGGLKANFQLEQGFNIDNGTAGNSTGTAGSQAFDRQAWVGLSGGFGEVQFGKTWSSYDDIRLSANDNFNAIVAASFRTWVGYNDRPVNSIKYLSPTFGGFSGSVTYGLGEDKTATTSAGSLLSIGAQYANGPLFVGFAHQQEKAGNTFQPAALSAENAIGTVNQLVVAVGGTAVPALSAGAKVKYNLLNGSYDFGVAKVVAGYNQVKATDAALAVNLKAKEWNLGAEVPLAANLNLGVGYAQSTLEETGTDFAKVSGYTASLVYSLSKRTSVYGVLAQTKAENKGGTAYEGKNTLYAVGINHKF